MIRKIIISGFTGFIGNNLLNEAKKHKFHVSGISRKNRLKNLYKSVKTYKSLDKIQNTRRSVLVFLNGNPIVNGGTKGMYSKSALNQFKKIKFKKFKKVIFVSSSIVYDNHDKQLRKEKYIRPTGNGYKLEKLYCENKTLISGGIVVRLSNVIGKKMHSSTVVSEIIKQAKINNKVKVNTFYPIRDFIHISDVVGGIIKLVKFGRPGIYNLGSGIGTDIQTIGNYIQDEIGSFLSFESREKLNEKKNNDCIILNNKKMKVMYNWKPKIKVRFIIKKLLE